MINNTCSNRNFPWIPNPDIALVCAYMAGDVYNPSSAPKPGFIADWDRIGSDKDKKPETVKGEMNGEELYNNENYKKYFQRTPLQPDLLDTALLKCFFARCYQSRTSHELVIAYRGTDNLGNIIADRNIGLRWFSHWSSYDDAAIAFYHYVLKNFQSQTTFPAPIWLTGHSLGGYLAQIVAAQHDHNTVAIVFNAPGVGGLTGPADDPHSSRWPPLQTIKDHYQNIFNVDSSTDDPVHYTGGYQIGNVHNFPIENLCQNSYSPFEEPPPVSLIHYSLCQHAIETVRAQAEKYKSEEQQISNQANAVYAQELAAMQK